MIENRADVRDKGAVVDLVFRRWKSQILHAGVKLGVFEALGRESREAADSAAHICDVGGGHGHLLRSLLAKHPTMRGTVAERAEVLADPTKLWAKKVNVAGRCEYVVGDMFAGVPSADAYFLKHILHDWNDEECVQILSNVRGAGSPKARVFVAEYVVPGPETPQFAVVEGISGASAG